MKDRLPIALSVTALIVSVLGFTPVGEAAKRLVVPRNSVGSGQLKAGAVKRSDIGANAVDSAKVANGSLLGADFKPGELPKFAGTAAGGDLTGTYPDPTLKDGAVTPAKVAALPAARVYNSANQSIPGNAAFTTLTFNTERFDTAGLHRTDLDASRITAPTAGLYELTINISWETNATGARELNLRKNGVDIVARDVVKPTDAPNSTEQSITTLVSLAAGDYVEVVLRQNSGAALNIVAAPQWSPEFSAIRLSAAS